MSQGQGYERGAPATHGAHLSPRFQAMPTMMHVYHSNPANQGEEDFSQGKTTEQLIIMTQPPQLSPRFQGMSAMMPVYHSYPVDQGVAYF